MDRFLKSENLLQTVVGEAEKNAADARSVVSGLSDAQLNWQPAPDKWSIAQCLEHLPRRPADSIRILSMQLREAGNGSRLYRHRLTIPLSWAVG
jgi:DinB family protein